MDNYSYPTSSLPKITRDDQLIFQGLQRAIVENKALIKIDFSRLNRKGSPFFNPWENFIPLLVILLISLAVLFFETLFVSVAVLVVLAVFYAFLLPYFLTPVMQNRVLKRIVPKIERFLIAWRYGGLTITLVADQRYCCEAPYSDWREFTKAYFPDLIPVDIVEVN